MPDDGYYAVIFASQRTPADEGYGDMAARMLALAAEQPGFLGVEGARDATGQGITVSYWRSLEDIRRWRNHAEHLEAQRLGKERWYQSFRLRIAKVIDERTWAAPLS